MPTDTVRRPTGALPAEVRMGLSVGIATGLYGLSFGALGVAAGLDMGQTVALSLLMFTGGSQFAFVGVLAGGGGPAAATVAASLLGVRNGVYGLQLNALLRPRGWRKVPVAHLTIDESMAVASAQSTPDQQRRGFWSAGTAVWVLWTLCTALGACAGDALGDPRRFGLDGAAVAAFIGLLWPRLTGRDPWAVAAICALVTALTIPFVPPGLPIVAAAVVAFALSGRRGSRP